MLDDGKAGFEKHGFDGALCRAMEGYAVQLRYAVAIKFHRDADLMDLRQPASPTDAQSF
jgi:hypothetical protein